MLDVGDKAPDFDLLADDGSRVKSKDLKGKSFVLYFYPKDDTPGCTKEACSFRDNWATFQKFKVPIFGVSWDDQIKHQKFKEKYDLPFTLLSDTDKEVSKAFGVYKEKSMYGKKYWGIDRSTFVIGSDGKIIAAFRTVKVPGHTEEVLETLQ